ncbi:MAG: ArsR/SmtB family transcription factor [Saprospiraceae bacterium]
MEIRRDVFQAIADPTRRAIISMLAHKSMNVNAISDQFLVSRPAISKHLKILAECGLVEIKQQGRERFCEMKPEKLQEVSVWVKQYEQFWTERLHALEQFLTDLQTKKIEP